MPLNFHVFWIETLSGTNDKYFSFWYVLGNQMVPSSAWSLDAFCGLFLAPLLFREHGNMFPTFHTASPNFRFPMPSVTPRCMAWRHGRWGYPCGLDQTLGIPGLHTNSHWGSFRKFLPKWRQGSSSFQWFLVGWCLVIDGNPERLTSGLLQVFCNFPSVLSRWNQSVSH